MSFGDPWCGYPEYDPAYGSYASCYDPLGYSLEYPGYAAYPGVYGGTTIINNEAAPLAAEYSASTPGADAVAGTAPPVAAPPGDTATVYRSTRDHGAMAWSDTATSIIDAAMATPADQRLTTAKQYLGRTPTGAWEVTYEGRQDVGGVMELTCRGMAATSTGGQPTIVVRVNHGVGELAAGQRLSVTGRLTELSVDDSSNPAGLLVLENGEVSR